MNEDQPRVPAGSPEGGQFADKLASGLNAMPGQGYHATVQSQGKEHTVFLGSKRRAIVHEEKGVTWYDGALLKGHIKKVTGL